PAFAGMVLPKRNHMESAGFRWPAGAGESDGQELRHALAGHIIVRDFLIEQGAPPHNADSIAVIIGGHHGVPPTEQDIKDKRQDKASRYYGDEKWSSARHDLIRELLTEFDLKSALDSFKRFHASDASQM